MNCKKCNSPLNEDSSFCPNCGEKYIKEEAKTIEVPIKENKKSNLPLIIGLIIGGVVIFIGLIVVLFLVFTGFIFGKASNNIKDTGITETKPTDKKVKTVEISNYTFTLPDTFDESKLNGTKYIGTNDFYFSLDDSATSTSTYEELEGSKYYIAVELSKMVASNLSYVGIEEETYGGQDYLIFRYSYQSSSVTYYYDIVYTKLYDDTVFATKIDILPSNKKTGYEEFTKFIKSAVKVSNSTSKTDDNYMVIGDSTLGYLKLPGKWTKGSVAGASETAIQYVNNDTYNGSTANGSYIVTLNVWSTTPNTTTASKAADAEASYYNANDPDATNISVEKVKLGSFDAYKLSTQYKSDKVWVITWYIDGNDGLVHIIQVEGLDLTDDFFKIPESFSFTKIN